MNIPITRGMVNVPRDTVDENLVDRFLFADECAHGAHLLIERYVAKYGAGFRPADKSKGEKGALMSLDWRSGTKLDTEMNFLLKAFVFSAKSSVDKGLHLLHLVRPTVQPGNAANTFPDGSAPGAFGRFISGVLENRFDNFSPVISRYFAKWAETIVHLRLVRNNIKRFGKAQLEINLGRPCWKLALTKQDASDPSLKYSSQFSTMTEPVASITITSDLLYDVIAAELDHLLALSEVLDIQSESKGFVDAHALNLLCGLVRSFSEKLDRYSLRLDVSGSPDDRAG